MYYQVGAGAGAGAGAGVKLKLGWLFSPGANSKRRTLHSPNVTLLLKKLSLFILSMCIMNKRGERAHPCRSPTLTLKSFIFMPLTRPQTCDCLYSDLIAANS